MNKERVRAVDDRRLVTRRAFVRITAATGATLLAGRAATIFGSPSSATTGARANSSFSIGCDLPVNRLGFGAMRLTGEGIWGWPPDRENALKVLRRAVEPRREFDRHGGCIRPRH